MKNHHVRKFRFFTINQNYLVWNYGTYVVFEVLVNSLYMYISIKFVLSYCFEPAGLGLKKCIVMAMFSLVKQTAGRHLNRHLSHLLLHDVTLMAQ